MATATRICKVCGKEYPYCRTERKVAGVFRWQDVACSVEHGYIYLEEVLASRNEKPTSDPAPETKDDAEVVKTPGKRKSRKTSAKKAE